MDSINVTKLYNIINRAIAGIDKYTDEPINKEMHLFKERFAHIVRQHPQPSLFSERRPLIEEVANALNFCDAMEAYHLATDVDAKDPPLLSEQTCRDLLEGADIFHEHISPENIALLERIENNVKRRLPEYYNQYLLEDYRQDALFVIKQRKNYQKAIKNKQTASKDYERYALHFYEKITHDEEMKQIKICPEKIELYKLTIEIVDCLPKEKYNRTDKFRLKSKIWLGIAKGLSKLTPTDVSAIKEACNEANRYERAVENALAYAANYDVISAQRRKKQKEEWDYH